MEKDELFRFLSEISRKENISEEHMVMSDLHLNSKEMIDLAIFVFNKSGIKIGLGKDISVKEILKLEA